MMTTTGKVLNVSLFGQSFLFVLNVVVLCLWNSIESAPDVYSDD